MESDQSTSPHQDAVYQAVEGFLQELMVLQFQHDDGVTDAVTVRRHIVEFLGTATLRPGAHRAEHRDGLGWADLQVRGGQATVRVENRRSGTSMQFDMDPIEARAFLLAANAVDTAVGFVARVFGDTLGELTYQRDVFLAGETPEHPARRTSDSDAGPSESDGVCRHGGLPPADSVPPYTIRSCPGCRTRMRAYPPSAGGPEWNEVPA